MKKITIATVVLVGLMFGGCLTATDGLLVSEDGKNISPIALSAAYTAAKIVYSDANHIVYEIATEMKRVDDEGFGTSPSVLGE